MAWMALVIMRMIVHPPNGLLREAVRILPDTLRLIRGLAADPTLPRAVRIRLAPLRSESFVPSLLSVPPGSFFGFLAPADGCFARRVGAVIAAQRTRWHRGQQRRSRPRGTHQQAHRGHAICSETKSATEPPSAHPQRRDRSSAVMRQEMRHRDLGLRGGGVTRGLSRLSSNETDSEGGAGAKLS